MKQLEELLKLPTWTLSTDVSAAAGYRDNVLLSSVRPDASGFVRGEAEAMLLRVPEGGFDGYVFLSALETRYLSSGETDHERTAFVTAEMRWQPEESFKFALQFQGYHLDQVFDVSTTEVSLDTAALEVSGALLSPLVRWNIGPKWWVEAQGSGRRDKYRGDVDGYDQAEGVMRIGRNWGHDSEVSISGARRSRSHDSRQQYTASGRPIFGSILKVRQNEAAVRIDHYHDSEKRWRTTLTGVIEGNRDNGSGYFDYDRRQFAAAVTWKRGPLETRLSMSVASYDFPVQLVGIGIAPESRRKDEFRVTLEAARRINESLSLLAFFERERVRSNDDRSRFLVNTGYLGVRWSWENLPDL